MTMLVLFSTTYDVRAPHLRRAVRRPVPRRRPGNGDGGGSAGPAEVELVVELADILWYIVGPYCAGLAVLALLVVVDTVNWDDVWPLHSSYKRRSKQYAAQKKTPEEAAASEVSPVEIAAARVVSPVWVTTV